MRYIACWGDDAWRDIGRGGDGSKGVLVSIPPSGVPWPRVRHNGKRLRSLALYEQGATWTRLDVLIECVIWMNGPNIWATLTTTVCTWSDLHDAFRFGASRTQQRSGLSRGHFWKSPKFPVSTAPKTQTHT